MNAGLGRHLSEEFLEEWVFHRLPGSVCASLEEHLLVCPTCQDRLAEIDEFVFVLKAAFLAPAASISKHSAA
ncbi:MAG TPA: hypothetical protein VMB25_17970 [Bryobacteraceae bacterium]|nr:hypothetical protein [Bryobacteraceae bacterium]